MHDSPTRCQARELLDVQVLQAKTLHRYHIADLLQIVMDLLEHAHHQPDLDYERIICARLIDITFVKASAHSDKHQLEQETQQIASLIAGILDQLRHAAIDDGCWSDEPVTPIMFG